jgi:hypothetical protein
MKAEKLGDVSVYTVAGSETARPLPAWLERKRRRSLKQDAEYQNRIELLQDFVSNSTTYPLPILGMARSVVIPKLRFENAPCSKAVLGTPNAHEYFLGMQC